MCDPKQMALEEKRGFAYSLGGLAASLSNKSGWPRKKVLSEISVFERGRDLVQDVLDVRKWVSTGENHETSSGRSKLEKLKVDEYLSQRVVGLDDRDQTKRFEQIRDALAEIIKDPLQAPQENYILVGEFFGKISNEALYDLNPSRCRGVI